jgi:hypothetical protein
MKNKITSLTIALLLGTALSFGQTWQWPVGSPNENDVIATFNNGTLTISGKGKMKDFYTNLQLSPSASFPLGMSFTIKKIVIEDGITHIGYLSFQNDYVLEEVSIAASVATIGDQAFLGCGALTSVTVKWPTPLSITSSAFSTNLSKATLHVPPGTKALYAAADVWKDFGTILEGSYPASIQTAASGISVSPNPARDFIFIHSDLPVKGIELYSLTGSLVFSGSATDRIPVASLPAGIYLLRIYTDSGTTIKKLIKK